MATTRTITLQAIAKISDPKLKAEVQRIFETDREILKTSPGGSRFARVTTRINTRVEEIREFLVSKGFSREEVVSATSTLRETRPAVRRELRGRTAEERIIEAKRVRAGLPKPKPIRRTITIPKKDEVKVAFGGPTKDATPTQIAEARRTGQDVFIAGERIPARDIGKARAERIGRLTAKIEERREITTPTPFELSTEGQTLVGLGQVPTEEPLGRLETFKRGIETKFGRKIEESRQLQRFAEQEKVLGRPFGPTSPGRKAQVFAGLTFVGLRATRGFVTPFIRPVQTAKGILSFIRHPIIGARLLAADFKAEPVGTTAELFGLFKGVGVIGRVGLKGVPKPAKGVIEIPTPKEPITIKTFGVRAGTKGFPLVTTTPRGLKFGRTDISPELTQLKPGVDIKIGGALETTLIRKGLRKAPDVTIRGMGAIVPAQRVLIKTRRVKVKEKILPTETERLGPVATKIVLDIAKEEKAVVFGSFARKAQDPAGRIPRDIDIRIDKATGPDIQRISETAAARLRKVEPTVRLRADQPGVIEIKRGRIFEKAVEFKGKEPMIEGEFVPEQILGLQKVGKPIKVKGQKITSLPEELRGVTQGVIRVRKGERGVLDIGPPPKRVKDIGSMLQTGRTLAEARLVRSKVLEKNILKLEELFGKQKVIGPPQKLRRIADFGPSPIRVGIGRVPRPTISPTIKVTERPSPISPASSISPRISPSALSISPRPSPRPSPRVSPARSVSPSISPRPSPSVSPIVSPSPSKSPIGKSISPFPSPRPSISPSISPRPSPSISPSISPGPPTPFGPSPPLLLIPLPEPGLLRPIEPKPRKKRKRKFRGTPSLSVVLGGMGTPLTRGQITGKEFISPGLIRQINRRI